MKTLFRGLFFGIIPIGLLALLAGCESTGESLAPFVEADHAGYLKTGTGVITGQASAPSEEGLVTHKAGVTVLLMPDTPHFVDWVQRETSGQSWPPPIDEEALKYVRATVSGTKGRFSFQNLPNGRYIVFVRLTWQNSGAQYSGADTTPTVAYVEITRGETENVVLQPAS
jgi:hypothetical protein